MSVVLVLGQFELEVRKNSLLQEGICGRGVGFVHKISKHGNNQILTTDIGSFERRLKLTGFGTHQYTGERQGDILPVSDVYQEGLFSDGVFKSGFSDVSKNKKNPLSLQKYSDFSSKTKVNFVNSQLSSVEWLGRHVSQGFQVTDLGLGKSKFEYSWLGTPRVEECILCGEVWTIKDDVNVYGEEELF